MSAPPVFLFGQILMEFFTQSGHVGRWPSQNAVTTPKELPSLSLRKSTATTRARVSVARQLLKIQDPYLPRWDETGDTFHLG